MMAIVLHSIGAMGKLYSEAIESIDPGPIEAITATGASRSRPSSTRWCRR
jgi:phosphonate transport system permease protein